MDPRIDKLADLLVNYSVAVKPGDKVLLEGSLVAEPLLKAIYVKILQAGGLPFVLAEIPGTATLFYKHASEEQLKYVHEPLKLLFEKYDCLINILSDTNTKELSAVDPARMVTRRQAQKDLMNTYLKRAAEGSLRRSLALYQPRYAQDANEPGRLHRLRLPGVHADMNDPVGYWKKIAARLTRSLMAEGQEEGAYRWQRNDLRLSIEAASIINCCCQ